MEDYSHHIYEDGTRALTEESHVKDGIGEIEFNFFQIPILYPTGNGSIIIKL